MKRFVQFTFIGFGLFAVLFLLNFIVQLTKGFADQIVFALRMAQG